MSDMQQRWREAAFHAFEQHDGDSDPVDAAADAAVLVLLDHLLSVDPNWPLAELSRLRQAITGGAE